MGDDGQPARAWCERVRRWRMWGLFIASAGIAVLFAFRPWSAQAPAGWELLVQCAAVLAAGLSAFALLIPGSDARPRR